jgi:hypothetical protein
MKPPLEAAGITLKEVSEKKSKVVELSEVWKIRGL